MTEVEKVYFFFLGIEKLSYAFSVESTLGNWGYACAIWYIVRFGFKIWRTFNPSWTAVTAV